MDPDIEETVGEANDSSTDAEYLPDEEDALDDSESDKRTKPNNKYKKIASKIDVTKLFRIDDSRKVAKCGLCSQEVHFTKTYAEMKYHIIKVHGDDEVQDSSTLDEEGTKDYTSDGDKERVLENDSEQSENKKSCRRSNNWKYFELVDEVNKIARCNTCGRELSYSTVSNLKKHLVRMHSDKGTLAEFACSPELKSKHVPNKIKPQSRFRSSVWKFFDVVDEKAKIATCRLCANKFSYNCLSNIWKHLTRMHNGEFSSSDEEGEAEVLEEQNSPVWAYFKCLSQDLKIASCLICKKRVDYNDTRDLSKHLSRKHPQVQVDLDSQTTKPKKLMITGNGDIYEIDEEVVKEEPVNVQEVKDNGSDEWPYNVDETDALDTSEYLDENIFNDPPVPTKKRRQSYKRVLNREDDRSHVTTQKSSLCEESSLDIFGKYMVSLLKKLPKHKSDQLQVDFVRQIMEAQNDSDITRSKNTRSLSSIKNTHTQNTIDDTRVTSNSEVQRVITHDGEIQHVVLGNEQIIVTSAGDEITVRTTE